MDVDEILKNISGDKMKGAIGLVFYSHVIPFILGLIGILLMCTGVMDDKPMYTSLGLIIFLWVDYCHL